MDKVQDDDSAFVRHLHDCIISLRGYMSLVIERPLLNQASDRSCI